MNPKVKESLKTVFMLPMALALFLIGAAKRLIIAVFLIGLLLPLIPKGMQENFLRLPIVERASPLFLWLIEHGLHLCLVITFLAGTLPCGPSADSWRIYALLRDLRFSTIPDY